MKNHKIIKTLATSGVILSLGMGAFGISKIDNTQTSKTAIEAKSQSVNVASRKLAKSVKDSKHLNIAKNVQASNTSSNRPVSSNGVSGANNSQVGVQATANKTTTNNSTATTPSTTAPTTATTSSTVSDKYIAEIEQLIFNKVNQERAKAGVSQLSYNSTMEHYARFKSQDMGDRGYFDHKNPEGQLITEKMKADGVNYMAWGENIAYIQGVTGNSTLADNFMTNWMNSPGHKANILSTNYSSIGIGVYKIGDKYYATQEFYK